MNFKEFTDEYIEAVMKGFGRKVEMTCFVDPLKPHALVCKETERVGGTNPHAIEVDEYKLKGYLGDIMLNEILNTSFGQLYSKYRHMWE